MKRWLLLSSVVLGLGLSACSSPPVATPPAGDAAPAAKGPAWVAQVKGGAPLIDVRSQGEWDDDGHIEGASLIPVDQFEGRIAEVEAMVGGDKTKPVVVHCRSGARSSRAKAMLERAGFTNVLNAGGFEDVRELLAPGN